MELFDARGKPIRHARDIRYDNLVSGLSATDLQAAIDELAAGSASYTDEDAQDAVGSILTDSATIKFTYDDATPEITATLSEAVLGSLALADSAIQPSDLAQVAFSGDYSDLNNTPSIPPDLSGLTLITADDETSSAPSSLQLIAGDNVTFDTSTPNQLVINASGGGGSGTVESVVPGFGILVDDDDPAKPEVSIDVDEDYTWTGQHAFTHGTRPITVSSSTQISERIRLAGQEFFASGNSSTDGIALVLGVNRTNNRQLWIFDSANLEPSDSKVMFRIGLNNNSLRAFFDCLGTDGETVFPVSVSSPIWLGDHSASAPGLTFANDTDTGIFRSGANILGIAAGGVERVLVEGSGSIGTLRINSQTPRFVMTDTDAVADRAKIRFSVGSSSFLMQALSADEGTANTFFALNTSGTANPSTLTLSTAGGSLVLDSAGRIYGTNLHNNSSSLSGTSNHYIGSGTYTPTVTGVNNVSSVTATACQWMRVGNVVTVSGRFLATASNGAGSIRVGISLPIASSLTELNHLGGVGSGGVVAQGSITADVSNDRAEFISEAPGSTSSTSYSFVFTYVVR